MSWLYEAPTPDFVSLARGDALSEQLSTAFAFKFDRAPSPQERLSWSNSLLALADLLDKPTFEGANVFLEFQMPLSSARCDALLVGTSVDGKPTAVVLELKQWQNVSMSTIRDSVAVGKVNHSHPSAQARSYCNYQKYYHEAFTEGGVHIAGCSFLHNMTDKKSSALLRDPAFYGTLSKEYPVFTQADGDKLQEFLSSKVGEGQGKDVAHSVAVAGI